MVTVARLSIGKFLHCRRWLLTLSLLTIFPSASFAQDSIESVEAGKLKAAFIYNFLMFIELTHRPNDGDLQVCVFGDNAQDLAALQSLHGKRIGEQSVSVNFLGQSTQQIKNCDLAYFQEVRTDERTSALSTLKGHGGLLVSDSADLDGRAMIRFLIKESKLRFNINLVAAKEEGINISSRLLNLAEKVEK